jgi:carbon-monoxide dehydrogenase medium subunit
VKLRQPASGFAIVGVAVRVTLDAVHRITSVGIGVTGVNGVPFRAKTNESRLLGQMPDSLTFRGSCGSVSEADPMEDIHASADYRRHLLAVFAARALERASERALA